jgi:NAD+ synthase (glutamine-hydrolysing)
LFFSFYDHGFIRAAVCVPEVRVAVPAFNVAQTIDLLQSAVREKAWLEQLNRIPSADH